MNIIKILTLILLAACGAAAQQKIVRADEIIGQINSGKAVALENAIVTGDFDLTRLSAQVNDAVYDEKGRTAKVFSGIIREKVMFKNVKFTGSVNFFRSEADAREIREYRVQFKDSVEFLDCVFEANVNFELTNFDNGVSFENSVFKRSPLFIRIGLERKANFSGTVFEQPAIYQFTQNTGKMTLSAAELEARLDKLKKR